jgi:hypothetical protein
MPASLGQNTLSGIDQNYREIGCGCSCRHVSGVLLVPGRIGDDEPPCRRCEEAIRHVDGDSLLAFGLQPVDQERKVDALTLRPKTARVSLERASLVFEDCTRLVQQPANQG